MKIKTYVVSTLSEAVSQIKKELGPEAVILSTRKAEIDPKKWWKFKTPRIEVTAAIDMDDAQPRGTLTPPASFNQVLKILSDMTEDKIGSIRKELGVLKESVENLKPGKNDQTEAVEPAIISQAVSNINSLPSNVYSLTGYFPFTSERLGNLKNGADAIIKTCQKLLRHGLDPQVVKTVSDHLIEEFEKVPNTDADEAAAQILMEMLPEVAPYHPEHDRRILVLVGPTGSGKTTTLAKLASQIRLEHKKTVGFITVDHFRIGAEEQIKKYASIFNAPCELVKNSEEFKIACQKMANVEVLLVDTVGRSPNDPEGIQNLAKLFADTPSIWKGLVVPATLKEEDLANTLQSFSPLQYNRIIVSKMDETFNFGGVFNASYLSQLPLAHLTMLQNVPEDIEEATKERVLDCLFNFSGVHEAPPSPVWKLAEQSNLGDAR